MSVIPLKIVPHRIFLKTLPKMPVIPHKIFQIIKVNQMMKIMKVKNRMFK